MVMVGCPSDSLPYALPCRLDHLGLCRFGSEMVDKKRGQDSEGTSELWIGRFLCRWLQSSVQARKPAIRVFVDRTLSCVGGY
jgi:hypothetical protein